MWKRVSVWLMFVALAACVLAQPIAEFSGLGDSYSRADTIEFSVTNNSDHEWLYVVQLERQTEVGWYAQYSSIDPLAPTGIEPYPRRARPGETQTLQWRPSDDRAFAVIYERTGPTKYRLVLRHRPRLDLAYTDVPSKAFEIR
jgi:hypothetical protein